MDDWELENVFDAEFGHAWIGKERREKIRLEHEAFWSTGQWGPPNYVPAHPAITVAERNQFTAFHGPRTQAYSCVLPGEIVRQCVMQMAAGTLNAVGLLNIEHLVVDEFQDLNPMDLQFVDTMVTQGARVFVTGDDDQSIYSFRFASPAGIQSFVANIPTAEGTLRVHVFDARRVSSLLGRPSSLRTHSQTASLKTTCHSTALQRHRWPAWHTAGVFRVVWRGPGLLRSHAVIS